MPFSWIHHGQEESESCRQEYAFKKALENLLGEKKGKGNCGSRGKHKLRREAFKATYPVSAADYRDSLLSGKLTGGVEGVSDDNALVVIYDGRLKELLSTSSCDICGETAQTQIKRNYFDCEVEVIV